MRILRTALFVGFLCFFAACVRDARVKMLQELPPQFELSGSGRLAMVRVHGQKVRDGEGETAFINWEIEPKSGRLEGTPVEDLGVITYGKVPDGYRQLYPEKGETLPELIEGQKYHVFFDTTSANGAHIYFEIKQGKLIEIE